ncbi:TadE/TadG family type IV pilus assembly protein [Brucella intermedia]|uniref:TadE/TadG family type IV pilus assembly protein n=1 Tax=Brucella intermedia TaxID=94625 RepID=UPI0004690E81|nr:hypothetical protein [Brucella intermedia]
MLSPVFRASIENYARRGRNFFRKIFPSLCGRSGVTRFIRADEASVAIETAACIGPLLVTVFVLVNFSIVFTGKQVLSAAIDQSVRQMKVEIRKGNSITDQDVTRALCVRLSQIYLVDCKAVDIELQPFRTIQAAARAPFPGAPSTRKRPIGAQDVVRLVATYRWTDMFQILPSFFPLPSAFADNMEVRTWINE